MSPFFLNLLFPDGVGLAVVCTEWFFWGEVVKNSKYKHIIIIFSPLFKKMPCTVCIYFYEVKMIIPGKSMLWWMGKRCFGQIQGLTISYHGNIKEQESTCITL